MGCYRSRKEIPDSVYEEIWIDKERNGPQIYADFIALINADRRNKRSGIEIWIDKERNSPQIYADFIALVNADRRSKRPETGSTKPGSPSQVRENQRRSALRSLRGSAGNSSHSQEYCRRRIRYGWKNEGSDFL